MFVIAIAKISKLPSFEIFLVSLHCNARGNWNSLRDCLAVKGIPFLVLCRDGGKRGAREWEFYRNNGMRGNSLDVVVSCWDKGGKP